MANHDHSIHVPCLFSMMLSEGSRFSLSNQNLFSFPDPFLIWVVDQSHQRHSPDLTESSPLPYLYSFVMSIQWNCVFLPRRRFVSGAFPYRRWFFRLSTGDCPLTQGYGGFTWVFDPGINRVLAEDEDISNDTVRYVGDQLGPVTEVVFDETANMVEFIRVQISWNVDWLLRLRKHFQFVSDDNTLITYRFERFRNFCTNYGSLNHDVNECDLSLDNGNNDDFDLPADDDPSEGDGDIFVGMSETNTLHTIEPFGEISGVGRDRGLCRPNVEHGESSFLDGHVGNIVRNNTKALQGDDLYTDEDEEDGIQWAKEYYGISTKAREYDLHYVLQGKGILLTTYLNSSARSAICQRLWRRRRLRAIKEKMMHFFYSYWIWYFLLICIVRHFFCWGSLAGISKYFGYRRHDPEPLQATYRSIRLIRVMRKAFRSFIYKMIAFYKYMRRGLNRFYLLPVRLLLESRVTSTSSSKLGFNFLYLFQWLHLNGFMYHVSCKTFMK